YVMLDKPDPIDAASQVVAAYHQTYPLTEPEVDTLFTLAAARLCLSVCYSAYQLRRAPHNAYLGISTRPAWALLEKLAVIPSEWATCVFRHKCGFPPCPGASRVRSWLSACDPAPVMQPDPRSANSVVFDFGVASAEQGSPLDLYDA